jgi:hypothetical protein
MNPKILNYSDHCCCIKPSIFYNNYLCQTVIIIIITITHQRMVETFVRTHGVFDSTIHKLEYE